MDSADLPYVVVRSTSQAGRVPVDGRLFVGRECAGVDAAHRLLLDDRKISRQHLEIRVESDGSACVFDTSTNGTSLNNAPLERAVPAPLEDGDTLQLGDTELEFHHAAPRASDEPVASIGGRTTLIERPTARMALVAGDVIGYSGLAEVSESAILGNSIHQLFTALREPLRRHRGMLSHIAGDAFFAAWVLGEDGSGAADAVEFAVDACNVVDKVAAELPVRAPDGSPLRMGWGVSLGDVALTTFTGGRSTILGDPANVAFRLATVAARDGHEEILVTAEIGELAGDRLGNASAVPMPVKGRATPISVLAVRR